jgi:NAD+ synthase
MPKKAAHRTPDLSVNPAVARKILADFIRSEIQRAGFERAVIGLSGGLDSAVSLVLAVEALGAGNVLAVRLPYRESSPDSLTHAQQLIDQFSVNSRTVEITSMADAFLEAEPKLPRERRGSILARLRMIVLYDQSRAFNGLVVGTSNKSEMLLGYTTLWGDMAAAIQPLGDLYKTQVRQLARALDIPTAIVDKVPTADLWIGQTDEGQLGFSYEQVDQLMFLMVDGRYDPEECIEAGFERAFVGKVSELIRRNQFKRMMPPIAKLSNRTIGYDFLYLRDWGT